MNHITRVTHHDTGAVETYCGETMSGPRDDDTAPICPRCFVTYSNHERNRTDDALATFAAALSKAHGEDRQRWIGWYDSATLRIERLERRMAKKGGKR